MLRRRINIPENSPIIKVPILLLPTNAGRYFLAFLDYHRCVVLVLGSRKGGPGINMYADWAAWGGERIWKAISQGFGWELDDRLPKVIEVDWIPVIRNRLSYYRLY
jgi:hypothetical protein